MSRWVLVLLTTALVMFALMALFAGTLLLFNVDQNVTIGVIFGGLAGAMSLMFAEWLFRR